MTYSRRGERGEAAATVVIVIPILVGLVWLALFAGQLASAQHSVVTAARDAARTVTADSTTSPEAVAATQLAAVCDNPTTTVTGDMEPGTAVEVTVSCTVDVAALIGWGPGTVTLDHTARSVIDHHRSRP